MSTYFARLPLGPPMALLVALTTAPGCGSVHFIDEPEDTGSSVEYVPRAAPATASVPRAMPARSPTPYAAPTQVAFASRSSTAALAPRAPAKVRYEPIRRPDAITSEELWSQNDDHDAIDEAEVQDRSMARGDRPDGVGLGLMTASSGRAQGRIAPRDETPLEDRREVVRPRPEVRDEAVDRSIYGPRLIAEGLAFPYPTTKFFRGFGPCSRGRHSHEGIDLGGVGPQWGIGTPIRSMSKAEILFIGTGDADPEKFGSPDKRDGEALRGDKMLPRSKHLEGYGEVFFFTRTKGRWRSGNIMVTRALEGPLEGHTIRYLHLAAFRPDLAVGDVLEVGEELGVMGGTGVQESAPHLHLDIADPEGARVDVAPLLGLAPTATCKSQPRMLAEAEPAKSTVVERKVPRKDSSARDKDLDDEDEREDTNEPTRLAARSPARGRDPYAHIAAKERAKETPPEPVRTVESTREPGVYYGGRIEVPRCKSVVKVDDFASGRFARHTFEVVGSGKGTLSVTVKKTEGKWRPKLTLDADGAKTLASGKLGGKAAATTRAGSDVSKIEITGWDGQPETDASYTLEVSEKCRR